MMSDISTAIDDAARFISFYVDEGIARANVFRAAKKELEALTTRLAPDRTAIVREAVWRSIDTAPEWVPVVVSDGSEVALSARSRTDDGYWYWAVEPEDALWFEPTMWTDAPSECPAALTPATAPDREAIARIIRETCGGAMILLPQQADQAADAILSLMGDPK